MVNFRFWAKIIIKALLITIAIILFISAILDMLFGFYPDFIILLIIILPIVFGLTYYFS